MTHKDAGQAGSGEQALSWLPLRAVQVKDSGGFNRLYTKDGHFIASCVNAVEAAAFVELCNSHASLSAENATLRELIQSVIDRRYADADGIYRDLIWPDEIRTHLRDELAALSLYRKGP